MTLIERLAQALGRIDFDAIPRETITFAKERLLDTIGAVMAGRAEWGYCDAVQEAFREERNGTIPLLGGPPNQRWPVARASMLNAAFASAMELDDGHRYASAHAGAVVIPVALTVGASCHATGREILTAIVCGYEVIYRLAVCQAPDLLKKGFHPSSICDAIGGAAVAGLLLKLDTEQMANALGLAAQQAGGSMEGTVSGQQSKCIMVANAAMLAVTAAQMAGAGIEGCRTVLEGPHGLFQAMSRPLTADQVMTGFGAPFSIGDTYTKFYPICRHAQPAIEAVLRLMETSPICPNYVERVEVDTYQVSYDLTGNIIRPETPGEARFSIPYGIAVALREKGISLEHLDESHFRDLDYLSLAEKVTVQVTEAIQSVYPKQRGSQVRIFLRDGTVRQETCFELKGSPENPAAYTDLLQKFIHYTALWFPRPHAESIAVLCGQIENLPDCGQLYTLACGLFKDKSF